MSKHLLIALTLILILSASPSALAETCNALNNIPQAVDEQEYTTLIGASKLETNKILDAIVAALRKESSC